MTAIRIDGATRMYAIVGDPIAQVGSPAIFSGRFAAQGANAVLVPAHVPPEQFESVFPALMALRNLDGLLVTVPFKPRAVPFAARLGKTAATIGALNALRREPDGSWTGEMFDGAGFVRAAEAKGESIRGRRVAIFGAGGAGSAIACALAESHAASIHLIDPLPGRTASLAEKLAAAFPACRFVAATAVPDGADMIVNASTVGMHAEDGLPGSTGTLAAGALVGDVILSEAPTALLRQARERGCATVSGREMLAGQADAIVAFFSPALSRA